MDFDKYNYSIYTLLISKYSSSSTYYYYIINKIVISEYRKKVSY